jgi:amino acid adenylation domain-containing protein
MDRARDSTIAEAFRRQAALTPDAIAVAAQDRQLSYREIDERSNRLARHLQSLGVKPETLVGVLHGRSETLVVSLLGILKAGGAYVPLDPSYPRERLSLVLEDSEMRILLTSSALRSRLALDLGRLTLVDPEDPILARQTPHPVASEVAAHNLAYVMYTSGSTGKPKGVMVEHRNVVSFFAGMDRAIGSKPGVWIAVTSVAFDISVLELLWTLTRGFKVVIDNDEGADTMCDRIVRHGATHLQMTPSLARMLMLNARTHSALGTLRQILLGGEAVPTFLIHRLRQFFGGELLNMYGPTETTIWSSTYRILEPGATVPIGRPIAGTQIHLLDAGLKPVPAGEIGELFIAGDGVARGYWKQPDLTAARFLSIPSLSESRIYRTGDMGRLLPDGNIEFLGRADDQVKLRGHRIEPGEIEFILEQIPGVKQAVIVAREDREGDMRLVACVVAEETGPEAVGALKNTLKTKLPETMIPSSFVFLSSLPLTENGKIDRKALLNLPPPAIAGTSTPSQSRSEYGSEIEHAVASAWKEALGVSEVGFNDNFFDLGAHSLTVAEAHAKLQNTLGREIPLVDLFQFSTVSSLARHLSDTQPAAAAARIAGRAQRRRSARQR